MFLVGGSSVHINTINMILIKSRSISVSCNCQSLLLDLEFIGTLLWSAMSLC